jgi:hypothetical protein
MTSEATDMSLQGLVQPTDISALDVAAFRKLVNRLLGIEASIHGVPLADVVTTLREFDPDGGVDARVNWPDSAPREILFAGDNVFQYKTGNVTQTAVKTEFGKSGVQKCLKAGGHYHFLISQDCNAPKLDKLQKALTKLCAAKGFDPKHCYLLAASHIARWVSHHPGAITCPELGKGLPGFSTVDTGLMSPPYKIHGSRTLPGARLSTGFGRFLQRPKLLIRSFELRGPPVLGRRVSD